MKTINGKRWMESADFDNWEIINTDTCKLGIKLNIRRIVDDRENSGLRTSDWLITYTTEEDLFQFYSRTTYGKNRYLNPTT